MPPSASGKGGSRPPSASGKGGSRPPSARQRAQTAPASFSKGLCQCCDDPALACTMWCCGPTATGQIYERMTSTPGSCLCISTVLWGVFFVSSILMAVGNAYMENVVYAEIGTIKLIDRENLTRATVVYSISSVVSFVGALLSTCALCIARRRIRDRDNIQAGPCGDVGDCCVTYWCGCCALTQMFSHENANGQSYNILSTTGS